VLVLSKPDEFGVPINVTYNSGISSKVLMRAIIVVTKYWEVVFGNLEHNVPLFRRDLLVSSSA
jgi:hypothetical protein